MGSCNSRLYFCNIINNQVTGAKGKRNSYAPSAGGQAVRKEYMKERLIELIEGMNRNQIIYTYTLSSKLFS